MADLPVIKEKPVSVSPANMGGRLVMERGPVQEPPAINKRVWDITPVMDPPVQDTELPVMEQ